MKINLQQISKTVLWILLGSILVYIILRAYHLSLTHDECLSLKIIQGDKFVKRTANDHVFHTFLMNICYRLFGARELSLRIPNILGFCIYAVSLFKILTRVKNPVLIYAGFCLLALSPYLIDFFGLARGYGLSVGLAMASLYFLLKEPEHTTWNSYLKNTSLYLGISLLAALTSYILINFNITLTLIAAVEGYFLWKKKKPAGKKEIAGIILLFALNFVFLTILVSKILFLMKQKELAFGGTNGFIDNIATILIHRTLYFRYYGEPFWIMLRAAIVGIFLLGILYQMFNKKYTRLSKITIVLFLMIHSFVLQHYIFDSFYPPERSSLIFIPLFGLFVWFFLDEVISAQKRYIQWTSSAIILLLICLPVTLHFMRCINLKYSREWPKDAHTKEVMQVIDHTYKTNDGTERITISNEWELEPSINYYRARYHMDYMEPASRNEINLSADYIYCYESKTDSITLNGQYHILKHYPKIHMILLKKDE